MRRPNSSTCFNRAPNGARIKLTYADSRVFVKVGMRAVPEINVYERPSIDDATPVTVLPDKRPPGLSVLNRAQREVEMILIERLAQNKLKPTSIEALRARLTLAARAHLDAALARLERVRLIAHPEQSTDYRLTGLGLRRAARQGYFSFS